MVDNLVFGQFAPRVVCNGKNEGKIQLQNEFSEMKFCVLEVRDSLKLVCQDIQVLGIDVLETGVASLSIPSAFRTSFRSLLRLLVGNCLGTLQLLRGSFKGNVHMSFGHGLLIGRSFIGVAGLGTSSVYLLRLLATTPICCMTEIETIGKRITRNFW